MITNKEEAITLKIKYSEDIDSYDDIPEPEFLKEVVNWRIIDR